MSMPVPDQVGWVMRPLSGGEKFQEGVPQAGEQLGARFLTELFPSPRVLTPGTSECDLIWKWVAADVISQDEVMLGGEEAL